MFGSNLILIFLISTFFSLPLAVSKTESTEGIKKNKIATDIENIVKHQAAQLGVPGFALGLVLNGKVVLNTAVGPRKLSGKEEPVNSQTLFQIGSIAKSFLAMITVKFHLQKKLQLDKPIKNYLPLRCKQNFCDGITVAQLLSHTSGIPASGINERIEKGESYELVISKALNAKKICAPGTCFQYNNAAYELAREILEKVESRPYDEILKKELFDPLKLNGTSTTFDALKRSNNSFVPHLFQSGRFKETNYSTAYYEFIGSSVLNSNLDDMLKFVSAELGNLPDVVSLEALKILHKPTTEAPDAYAWFNKPVDGKIMNSQYAIGHRLFTSPDLTVIYHPGWIKGCKSLMVIFPEQKMGLVLLQNSGSQLGFRVLEDVVHYLRTGKVK